MHSFQVFDTHFVGGALSLTCLAPSVLWEPPESCGMWLEGAVRSSREVEVAKDAESSPDPPPLLTKHLGQNIMNDDGSMKVARSEGVFQLSLQGNMQ